MLTTHCVLAIVLTILTFRGSDGASSPFVPPVPIPATSPGYVLGGGNIRPKVTIEAIIDLNCPDSAAAWPILQLLSQSYQNTEVAVVLQMLPLPYHRNSMVTTMGFLYINEVAPDQVENYITAVFLNVARFPTAATANMTDAQVLRMLSTIAYSATKVPIKDFEAHVMSYRSEVITWWKESVLRGVAGTPWYRINDVPLAVTGGITLNDWKDLISSILTPSGDQSTFKEEMKGESDSLDMEEEGTAEQIANMIQRIKEN